PDALASAYYYSDPYSGPMRFAIASLLVLGPVALWLLRLLQREARSDPQRQQLTIRRWLTYLTVLLAGATIVGDLIALLNAFLGGTLPAAFALKALALLLVMGAAFWYFVLDLRGYWQGHAERS